MSDLTAPCAQEPTEVGQRFGHATDMARVLLATYAPELARLPGVIITPTAALDSPEASRLRLFTWLGQVLAVSTTSSGRARRCRFGCPITCAFAGSPRHRGRPGERAPDYWA